jgi:hypothetical protein
LRSHRRFLRYWPAFLALSLVACLEEFEQISNIGSFSFGPWVDAPLVHTTFSASEFLTEGESNAKVVEQAGILTLTYDDEIVSPSAANYFQIPDQTSPSLVISGPEVTFPSSGASVTLTRNITFAFTPAQGEQFDSLWLTTGQIVVETSSTFAAGVQLSFTTPTIKLNGTALTENFNFNTPDDETRERSLSSHTIDLTLDGTTTNTVSFTLTAVITDTGQPINSSDEISLSFALNNMRFRALFGQLGTRTFPMPTDSVGFDVFAGITSRNFVLLSPLVDIQARNSYGLPVAFDIVNFEGITSDNVVVPLTGAAVSAPANPYLIAAPTYSQLGQSVTSNIRIDGQNSNLGALIGSLPAYLSYSFSSTLNPGSAVPQNFVLDTSRVRIAIHAELPFHGSAEEISFSKRLTFSGIGIDSVGETSIKIRTSNEFPFDARIQAYFLTSGGAVIDSLFLDATIIRAAPVDADGFTQAANEFITLVPLTQAKIDRIDQATQIEIAASISTTNNGTVPVKFSATDRLLVDIGVHTRLRYTVN